MAARMGRWIDVAAIAAGLSLVLWSKHDASARKFQLSGTWVMRNGQVFTPLQFAASNPPSRPSLHVSMGNLTGAFGFPNGPIPGAGGVTATGSAPATLRIPRHRFVEDVMALLPLNGITLIQISTNFGLDGPFATATLAPGGGPGSFTWCPVNPDCVDLPGTMWYTDPVYQGRIVYVAGPNRFGGAMQMGLKRGGDNVFRFNNAPFQAGHNRFGSAPATRRVAPGSGSPDAPASERLFLQRGVVTQPTMAPASFHLIEYPGPKLTTMLGLTATMAGPVFYLPAIAKGPMGTLAGQYTTHYGFGQTTGTVFAQISTYDATFFTFMGGDQRTPLGAGNLSLVAGGLSFRHTLAGESSYASAHKTWLTLAPPIPSVSPGGFVAAGALVLLAAGWALRRRFA